MFTFIFSRRNCPNVSAVSTWKTHDQDNYANPSGDKSPARSLINGGQHLSRQPPKVRDRDIYVGLIRRYIYIYRELLKKIPIAIVYGHECLVTF